MSTPVDAELSRAVDKAMRPPVTPFSAPGDIRDWLGELRTLRKAVASDATSVELVDQEIERVDNWLEWRLGDELRKAVRERGA